MVGSIVLGEGGDGDLPQRDSSLLVKEGEDLGKRERQGREGGRGRREERRK